MKIKFYNTSINSKAFHLIVERNCVPYEAFFISNGAMTLYLTDGQKTIDCERDMKNEA